jgi:hypothetical protein
VTVTYRDRAKHLRQQLRRLATELHLHSLDDATREPLRAEARVLGPAMAAAADAVSAAIDAAAEARDVAYLSQQLPRVGKRPSARAHPWRSRAVVPPRPKGPA